MSMSFRTQVLGTSAVPGDLKVHMLQNELLPLLPGMLSTLH